MSTQFHGHTRLTNTAEAAMKTNTPVLLVGESGTGKTTLVSALAQKHKKHLVRLSLDGNVGTGELIGKYGLKDHNTVWIDGPLVEAMRKGDWVVLDEVNAAAPEILFSLHSILDHERSIVLSQKDGEKVQAHKDFRVFATINPESYQGAKRMNAAFLSRFVVMSVLPLESEAEYKLVLSKHSISEDDASTIVAFAAALRDMHKNETVEYWCSTRDVLQAAALLEAGVPLSNAVVSAVVEKLSSHDREAIRDQGHETIKQFMGTLASPANAIRETVQKYEEAAQNIPKQEKALADLDKATREKQEEGRKLVQEAVEVAKEKAQLMKQVASLKKASAEEKRRIALEYLKQTV